MRVVTLRLHDATCERLKQLATSRGLSMNKLMEELGTAAIAAHDVEVRFRAMAAGGNRRRALDILERPDAGDRAEGR